MRAVPALEDSVLHQEQRMLMDAGLFHGKATRVGWGPGHNLAHSGSALQVQKASKSYLGFLPVILLINAKKKLYPGCGREFTPSAQN